MTKCQYRGICPEYEKGRSFCESSYKNCGIYRNITREALARVVKKDIEAYLEVRSNEKDEW